MTEYQAVHLVCESDLNNANFCTIPYNVYVVSDDGCEVICYNVIDRGVMSDIQYNEIKNAGHLLPHSLLRTCELEDGESGEIHGFPYPLRNSQDDIVSPTLTFDDTDFDLGKFLNAFVNSSAFKIAEVEAELLESIENTVEIPIITDLSSACSGNTVELSSGNTGDELMQLLTLDSGMVGETDNLVVNNVLFPSTPNIERNQLVWKRVKKNVCKYSNNLLQAGNDCFATELQSVISACCLSQLMVTDSDTNKTGYCKFQRMQQYPYIFLEYRSEFVKKYSLEECSSIESIVENINDHLLLMIDENGVVQQCPSSISVSVVSNNDPTILIIVRSPDKLWNPVRSYSNFWKKVLLDNFVNY